MASTRPVLGPLTGANVSIRIVGITVKGDPLEALRNQAADSRLRVVPTPGGHPAVITFRGLVSRGGNWAAFWLLSTDLAEPEASAWVLQAERHVLLEPLTIPSDQVAGKQGDPEDVVVHQERPYEVGFVVTPLRIDPLPRVLERIVDIVNMHDRSRLEARKNLEERERHVTACLGNVRDVKE